MATTTMAVLRSIISKQARFVPTRFLSSSSSIAKPPSFPSFSLRRSPSILSYAVRAIPPSITTIRNRVDRPGGGTPYSPLNNSSGSNFSDRPPTEMAPLFPGCDYEHWLIVMDKPGGEGADKQQMIDCYVQTLARVLGSEEEAKKKIYNVSCERYFGFGCEIDEETSNKLEGLPGVLFVLPDSYVDAENKDYGGCYSRGRSFAASVSSSSTPQRVPKRVSKDERRAMLKAFVDKYRASNSGKYPTPSAVQKQVGGSYYVVKKILQEIEYNSQRSSVIISTTNEAPFEKEVPREECPPYPEATEISSSAAGADLTSSAQSLGLKDDSQTVVTTNLDMDEAPFEKQVPQEECPPSLEATEISSSAAGADLTSSAYSLGLKDDSQTVVTTNLDMDEAPFEKEVPQEECPPSLEATEISSSAAGADLTSCAQSLGLKDDSQTVVATNLDMDEATSSITQAKEETLGTIEMPFSKDALNSKTPVNASNTDEDHTPQKRATVWGNLKSFADGIINMWRKM